ncbi:MAG TPA: GNAT family N-acetyltransferase [Acidimicrobiales bacterium]
MEGCRVATDDDLPRLAELARLAIAELTPMKGGDVFAAREARGEPIEASLKADLGDPDVRVLCGTLDGAVIGYAVVRLEGLGDGGRLGVLHDIFVELEAREVGVGEALVNDVVEWCQAAGCIGIDSFALPGNRSTKNFFETFGFTARMIVVHKWLRERPVDAAIDAATHRADEAESPP